MTGRKPWSEIKHKNRSRHEPVDWTLLVLVLAFLGVVIWGLLR